jgi:hypothetical protein
LKLEIRANDFKFDPKDPLSRAIDLLGEAIDLLDEVKALLRRILGSNDKVQIGLREVFPFAKKGMACRPGQSERAAIAEVQSSGVPPFTEAFPGLTGEPQMFVCEGHNREGKLFSEGIQDQGARQVPSWRGSRNWFPGSKTR